MVSLFARTVSFGSHARQVDSPLHEVRVDFAAAEEGVVQHQQVEGDGGGDAAHRELRERPRLPPRGTTFAGGESWWGGIGYPGKACVSPRTPGPPGGTKVVIVPGAGRKSCLGSSALMRHSMACPRNSMSPWFMASFSPAATRICHCTRSTPVSISVTGRSTWIRVFISMK